MQANGIQCIDTSSAILYISGAEFTQIDQVGVSAAFEELELPFQFILTQKTHWSFNH
jgi:hypothetical protein